MRRNTRRLPALLLVILLFLGMLPATAWAANFPSKFYAHLMNNSGMGTVSSSLTYTSKNTEAQQVHGMEYAGGVVFTVVGKKTDDGWRELRMYNSNLTNYRTIGTVNQAGGGYWIVDTAMDLSGAEPTLYGTYNSAVELPDGSLMAFTSICSINLTNGSTSNWLTVKGDLPSTDIIYAIAFDKNGTLYAIGADAGAAGGAASLYTIDLKNASGSQVSAKLVDFIKTSSGKAISTNYCQDLAFDHATGTLYWAENDDNVLYTLDATTAVATRVGQVKYSKEAYPIQSFCIPYDDTTFGQNKDQYMISVVCEGAGTVTSGDENKPFYMVNEGEDITLDIAPNIITGDDLKSVTVDGKSISTADLVKNGYSFSNVSENHVIEVTFKKEIPATQKTVYWLHYQGEPAKFYTVDNVYKFYDLPYLDQEVPREGYVQTLLDEDNQPIDNDEIILPGNYDVRVTHAGNADYAALDVTYEDALQLGKCPGTPGRPVVYGKVGCTQGDLTTTSALQDYYGSDGNLIDAAHDEIPVTLEWLNPETTYNEAGNIYASATIHAADELDQRLLDCYNLDGTTSLTPGCLISSRSTQVVVLPADQASLIKVQTSDASGGAVSGKGVYKNGETVTVTAAVNENAGYEFKGWQENGQTVSTNATYTFEASGDRTLTAVFETNPDYRVTLQTDPADAGTVTGGGSYEDGSHEATVEATAKPGYYFIGWYKDGQTEAVSTDAEYTFTVEEDGAALTAKFGVDYLARAELAKENLASALGKDTFEWQTLEAAVDAYEAAKDFVNDDELPSSIEDAKTRFKALTTYYNSVKALDLSDQGIDNEDLTELYLFTGVTDLNLSGNTGITDLTALKDLNALTTLDISGTGVTELDSLVTESKPSFPGCQNLTAQKLSLNSISALAQLVDADVFVVNNVTKWDFTGSTLPDTESSKADVKAIQDELGGKFIPPTIRTAPDPTPVPMPTEYGVVVADCAHGRLSAEPAKAAEGATVTVAATPDEGFEVRAVSVADAGGKAVEVSRNDDGTWTFEMPAGDVTVTATFGCDGGAACPSHGLSDVDQSQWYHDAVDWAVSRGVMTGYAGTGLFGPDDELSRAQMAQILWNVEGRPVVDHPVDFGDVREGDWHYRAVAWAASEGVFGGYADGSGLFGPDDALTREQAAAVLMRWAEARGDDVSARADLASYPDAGDVSDWAAESMSWAVAADVLRGAERADGTLLLDPQGTANRAQTATLMMRLIG